MRGSSRKKWQVVSELSRDFWRMTFCVWRFPFAFWNTDAEFVQNQCQRSLPSSYGTNLQEIFKILIKLNLFSLSIYFGIHFTHICWWMPHCAWYFIAMIRQFSWLKGAYYLGFTTRYPEGNKAQMKNFRSSENETGEPFTVTDNHRSLPS